MKDTEATHPEHLSARRVAVSRLEDEPTTERRADTQRRLLDAGRSIITHHGVGGASVGLITKSAGFSRGAFYSNFTDMDHFVTRLAQREWESVLATIGTTLNAAIPGAGIRGSHDTRADEIAAELLASTRPLLGPSEAAEEDYLTQVDILGRALLATIPHDRDFHLLWNSLANFMVRDPAGSSLLRQAFFNFRSGMAQYVSAALDHLGLRARVPSLDLVDIMIGIGTRSTQIALAQAPGDQGGGDLLDRTIPDLLRALIVPGTGV